MPSADEKTEEDIAESRQKASSLLATSMAKDMMTNYPVEEEDETYLPEMITLLYDAVNAMHLDGSEVERCQAHDDVIEVEGFGPLPRSVSTTLVKILRQEEITFPEAQGIVRFGARLQCYSKDKQESLCQTIAKLSVVDDPSYAGKADSATRAGAQTGPAEATASDCRDLANVYQLLTSLANPPGEVEYESSGSLPSSASSKISLPKPWASPPLVVESGGAASSSGTSPGLLKQCLIETATAVNAARHASLVPAKVAQPQFVKAKDAPVPQLGRQDSKGVKAQTLARPAVEPVARIARPEDISYSAQKGKGKDKNFRKVADIPIASAPVPVGLVSSPGASSSLAGGNSNASSSAVLSLDQASVVNSAVAESAVAASLRNATQAGVTTLNIKNIPVRLSQAAIQKLWPPKENCYDMLYLPFNHRQRRTIGYAFINFTSVEAALQFMEKWQGVVLSPENHTKALDIGVAAVQGFEANLLHMKSSNNIKCIRRKKHMPIIILPDGTAANYREVLGLVDLDELQEGDDDESEKTQKDGAFDDSSEKGPPSSWDSE
jgi:hypothetical protein